MSTVGKQIQAIDDAIGRNIELLADQRALLSQNLLAQLRNFVEAVSVLLHKGTPDAEFSYAEIDPALAFVKGKGRFNFLGKFHKLIQISASHYTLDGDASERLMLKYYEYLYRVRTLLAEVCQLHVLPKLELFPADLDPSLQEYHEKISSRIQAVRPSRQPSGGRDRYYIHYARPFFVNGHVYYEVTFYRALNKVSKFDRIIAFTDIDIADKYAAMLTLERDSIEVIGQTMPITLIVDWEVSIRPCEFDNFARIFGETPKLRSNSFEYRHLMNVLTTEAGSLLEIIDLPDDQYTAIKSRATEGVLQPVIFPVLDKARLIARSRAAGHNVLRYLMLRMQNQIIKSQYHRAGCDKLSGLKLPYGCIPFEQMPFCTSLTNHNPRYWDLAESLDISERAHELLARRIKNNVERHGNLYTPVAELADFGEIDTLISKHNRKLYHKHTERQLIHERGHVFIRRYEDETVSIIERLQEYASSKIEGFTQAIERWLEITPRGIDDLAKLDALKQLFSQSRVALIYGAAGTGKSTMVDHIANYFNDKQKLFLAHTNPAVDNLKRKVTSQNSDFWTISSQIGRKSSGKEYDLLVIDECSTVSNGDLIRVLEKTKFKLLVLVGDVYQIESIQFGNWFDVARSFVPRTSVFELKTPFRTKNAALLGFWNKVRSVGDDLAEVMARNSYSTVLDKTLFEPQGRDEIILCLNYDGLYGINNINRFLQSSNSNNPVIWRVSTYKVGDPVLFYDSERFRPVIYNNLKGRIMHIQQEPGRIQFDVELDRPLSEFDVDSGDLEWVSGSTVRFSVYDYVNSDDDDDALNTVVPFQVAYAVSIHKAQGLEYDSVKIVITDSNEDDITHSIFYTAITRARDRLRIFWTPETQQKVLRRLCHVNSSRDVSIIASRRGLPPIK